MEAIILCGGYAVRLAPITDFVPKPLLHIKGKPILNNIIDSLEDAKIHRYIISTNRKFASHFEHWISREKLARPGKQLDLIVENSVHNGEKFGAIKGVQYAIENGNVNDDLLLIAGDNFYDFELKHILDKFKASRKPTIALYDVQSLEEAKRFGVVKANGDKIIGFEEKPQNPQSTLISTGIYIFPKEDLHLFKEYLDGKNHPDAPGYFIKWLIERKEVNGIVYREDWYDIGTLETYKKVVNAYSDNLES